MEIIISRIIAYMFLAIMFIPMFYAVVSAFNRKYKTRSKYFLDRVVEIYMLETFGRVDRFIQHRLPVLVEKWGEAVVRIIAKFLAVAVTVFLVLHEFPDLLDNLNFMMLLFVWGMYVMLVLYYDYRKDKEQKEQPTSKEVNTLIKNVNELINEIRQDRNERKNTKQ